MELERFLFFGMISFFLILVSGCMVPVDYEPDMVRLKINESFQNEEITETNESSFVGNDSAQADEGFNETNATEEIKPEVVYGDAISKGNNTYMFKINDQVNISGKMIRVEKIYPDFVFVFIDDNHQKITLFETERIQGLNVTSTEIFYDNLASGRFAYLHIV